MIKRISMGYRIPLEKLFKAADKFPRHNLSPEDLEKMEEELYE